METKIIILNALKYADKKTGKDCTRLGFIFGDSENIQLTEKFKGLSELSVFYSTGPKAGEVFDIISEELIMKLVDATISEMPNPINPLKSTKVITSIKYKDHVYNLV